MPKICACPEALLIRSTSIGGFLGTHELDRSSQHTIYVCFPRSSGSCPAEESTPARLLPIIQARVIENRSTIFESTPSRCRKRKIQNNQNQQIAVGFGCVPTDHWSIMRHEHISTHSHPHQGMTTTYTSLPARDTTAARG